MNENVFDRDVFADAEELMAPVEILDEELEVAGGGFGGWFSGWGWNK